MIKAILSEKTVARRKNLRTATIPHLKDMNLPWERLTEPTKTRHNVEFQQNVTYI